MQMTIEPSFKLLYLNDSEMPSGQKLALSQTNLYIGLSPAFIGDDGILMPGNAITFASNDGFDDDKFARNITYKLSNPNSIITNFIAELWLKVNARHQIRLTVLQNDPEDLTELQKINATKIEVSDGLEYKQREYLYHNSKFQSPMLMTTWFTHSHPQTSMQTFVALFMHPNIGTSSYDRVIADKTKKGTGPVIVGIIDAINIVSQSYRN